MGASRLVITLRYGSAILLVLALVVYVSFLLQTQYRSQNELHRITLERFISENDKRAIVAGNFLGDRMSDLANLAENRDLALYYENKALGMTEEYGLEASLAIAEEVFSTFRERKRHKQYELFSRIIYLDVGGRKMLDLHGVNRPEDKQLSWSSYLKSDQRSPHFMYEQSSPADSIVISHPVMFKGQYVGQVLAWIPVPLVYDLFLAPAVKGSPLLNALSLDNRYIIMPDELKQLVPLEKLPEPQLIQQQHPYRIELPNTDGTTHTILAIFNRIDQTPFAMLTFFQDQNEAAARQSRNVLYAMAVVGLLLLGGGGAFLRTSIRNAALKAHLEESTLRERIVSEKNESLRKLSTAVEQSPVSITITDREGTIEYVNPKFCQVTGYSSDEVLGQNTRILKGGNHSSEFYKDMWDTILSGCDWRGEFQNRNRDGSLMWELASISPILDDSGDISHFVEVKENISEQKKLQEELIQLALHDKKAKEQAEQASRSKSYFLASMSHEIRTPLNAIIGMAELLEDAGLSEEQHGYVMVAKNAGETLLALINDILDLSKIEAGMLQIENSDFNVSSLIAKIESVMGVKAHEKFVDMRSVIAPDVPAVLSGDHVRLRQVLINLVGNAIKFTERGSITLSVELVKEAPDVVLRFSVKDTGIGIPADKQNLIFESFTQADASTTRQYGGTGLGLAISMRLVKMMGGELGVESVENRGSRFFFTAHFALGTSSPQQVVMLPKCEAGLPQRALRVLVVDDNKDNLTVLSAYFRKTSHCVETAIDGAKAVEKIKGSTYDLVLLDMEMPVMDGYTAASLIREWERATGRAALPIIALTANALKEDRQKSLDAGCTAHLTKPIHKEKLLESVEYYAQLHHNDTSTAN